MSGSPLTFGRTAVWHLALTDDVELRGREVWARPSHNELDQAWADGKEPDFTLRGVLAPEVSPEAAWQEIADAYAK